MEPATLDRNTRLAVLGLTALALGLRIAGAQGGLWLDEAWSAVLAHDVGTPAGVLLGINHDNNHHLNSLWLQAVGLSAPSWLMRLPAILTGTLAVPIVATIAGRQGRTAAIVTAWLFAVSPMLVTLGSEARGYAPMTLALLAAFLYVDRTLAGDARWHRPRMIALCFLLGALAQLTMVFGAIALCSWAFLTWWRRGSLVEALRRSLALFAVPLLALAAVSALIAAAAWASPMGFRFGSYDPFTVAAFRRALVELVGYTIGWPIGSPLLPIAAIAAVLLAPFARVSRTDFHRLAILAFPAMLALLQSGNPGYPRYYLLIAVALLLMLGELISRLIVQPNRARWLGAAILAGITTGSLAQDLDLARNRRGDTAATVRAPARLHPQGATVMLDRPSGEAILRVAAAQAAYPLRLATAGCPAQDFVFVNRDIAEPEQPSIRRCRTRYRRVAGAEPHGLSGTPWTLYRRTPPDRP